MKENKKKHSY